MKTKRTRVSSHLLAIVPMHTKRPVQLVPVSLHPIVGLLLRLSVTPTTALNLEVILPRSV